MYTLPIGTKITSPTTTYTITGVLGQGGFGITYSATCIVALGAVKAKANVALKEHFVKADCVRDDDTSRVSCSEPAKSRVELTRKDFIGEARRLKSIGGQNTNIVAVSEVFEANNTAYYAMEMIEGESLREYVASRGRLTEKEMLSIMTPIVDAVAFLHRNRITHLDIKPHNIMIATDDEGKLRPVLIDFGLSKHYDESGEATSTINSQGFSDGYAPIEQYAGITRFSPASDVYSLAATMVFCLNAKSLPAAHEVTTDVLEAALPANLTPPLRSTLIRALSLQAAKRHPDAGEFLLALGAKETHHEEPAKIPADEITIVDIPTPSPKTAAEPIIVKPKPNTKGKHKPDKGLKIALITAAICLIGVIVVYFISKPSTTERAPLDASAPSEATAPQVYADTDLVSILQNGKYGFADKNGNIVIPCEYDAVENFSAGMAPVNKNGKWGYIDKSGKLVVPLTYDYANQFYIDEEVAIVVKDDKYGLVDKSGSVVLPPIYNNLWSFDKGMALVEKDGKWGFVNNKGEFVVPLKYDFAWEYCEDIAMVNLNDKYGFINRSGEVVVPIIYDDGGNFYNGLAWVVKNGKRGYVNKSGETVIPFIYDLAQDFDNDGHAQVFKDGEWFTIDKSGNRVK